MEKYKEIEKDVVLLQESMTILNHLIASNQEPINTIEEMIHETKISTKQSVEKLLEADEIKNETNYFYFIGGSIVSLFIYFFL